MFLGFWLANSAVIWFVGQIVPQNVVLGNQHVSPVQASLFVGFLLSTVNILVEPTLELLKVELKQQSHRAGLLILVNTGALWLITKLALMVGVGIAAFWWAGVLGVTTMLGQWTVWKALKLKA